MPRPEVDADGLTPRRRRFVEEYPKDLNATAAAIRAGFSVKNAGKIGPALLAKPAVASAIKKALDARAKRNGITADRVLQRLYRIAMANLDDVMEWDSDSITIKPSSELSARARAGIAEVTERVSDQGSTRTIKMRDPGPALALLFKHLGLGAAEKHEHTGKDGKPIKVKVPPSGKTVDRIVRDLLGVKAPSEPSGAGEA